jgi:hypothetical protein
MAFSTPFLFKENQLEKMVARIFEAKFSTDSKNTTSYS